MKRIAKWVVALVLTMLNTVLWAQDTTSGSTTIITSKETTTTTTTEWYMQPWVWVAGGAVFIIILVALLRSGSNKDKTEVSRSTTVIKDRNP